MYAPRSCNIFVNTHVQIRDFNAKSRLYFTEQLSNKGNNKITELRTILQRESQNLIDRDVLGRYSPDKIIDSRGKDLLDLCIKHQLRILNGRALGDMFGHYTCYTPNGASVVDYVMVSEDILDLVLHFAIPEFIPTRSDTHCKLEWTLCANYHTSHKLDNVKLNELKSKYIWTNEYAYQFQLVMDSIDIKTKLDVYNHMKIDWTQISVDGGAAELTDLILTAADASIKKKPKIPIQLNLRLGLT